MSRLLLVLSAGMLAAGCGGGHGRRLGRPATPVAEQVRQALLGALTGPAIGSLPAQRAQLPYRDVTRCTGPAAGGAGLYRCATVPRGARGIRSLDVQVMASGQ